MEPMRGLERLTYALRMGTKNTMEMIDKALVSFSAMSSDSISTSTWGRFVSENLIRPDL
jgi:hypothetical protein